MKTKMLEIFKLMLKDWEECHAQSTLCKAYELHCRMGYCGWLNGSPFEENETELLDELFKDHIGGFKNRSHVGFWYNVPWFDGENEFLLPRIENLKRTIARLELEMVKQP